MRMYWKTQRERYQKNLATAKSSKRVRRLLVLEIKTESGLKNTKRERKWMIEMKAESELRNTKRKITIKSRDK